MQAPKLTTKGTLYLRENSATVGNTPAPASDLVTPKPQPGRQTELSECLNDPIQENEELDGNQSETVILAASLNQDIPEVQSPITAAESTKRSVNKQLILKVKKEQLIIQ